jgi:hypothetical protein
MRAIKHFLPIFVALSLTVAGMPFVHFQDVNKDRKVDLQDAIMLARGVVRSAENPGPLTSRVADAVRALHKVAEFIPNIELDDSLASFSLTNLGAYIPPDRPVIKAFSIGGRVDSFFPSFTSIAPVPIPHPPRA